MYHNCAEKHARGIIFAPSAQIRDLTQKYQPGTLSLRGADQPQFLAQVSTKLTLNRYRRLWQLRQQSEQNSPWLKSSVF